MFQAGSCLGGMGSLQHDGLEFGAIVNKLSKGGKRFGKWNCKVV